MSQQDVDRVSQHQLTTEQWGIKEEPENHDDDAPPKYNTQYMGVSTLATNEYLKFKILNDEIIVKDEPTEHNEDNEVHECNTKNGAKLFDQLKDEAQVKCDVDSEDNNDCSRLVIDESHMVAASSETYQCDLCEKNFSKKCHLTRHSSTHNASRPYKCSTCDKTFKQQIGLNFHVITHSANNPFTCYLCNKSYDQLGLLKTHIRSHTYKCDICNKSFPKKMNLESHNRMHAGIKPFKCNTCDKDFATKRCLEIHTRIHTGEKPFKCDKCNKSFRHHSTLKCHNLIHINNPSTSSS